MLRIRLSRDRLIFNMAIYWNGTLTLVSLDYDVDYHADNSFKGISEMSAS